MLGISLKRTSQESLYSEPCPSIFEISSVPLVIVKKKEVVAITKTLD